MTQIAMFPNEPKPVTHIKMTLEQRTAFDKFWDYFAHKQGKVPAQRAWQKQWKHIKPVLDRVYRAALMTAKERPSLTHTAKYAQGWISDHAWVDERFDAPKPPKWLSAFTLQEWRARLGPNTEARRKFIHHHFRAEVKHMPEIIRKEYGFTR